MLFDANVSLIAGFLARRAAIVDGIERLLNSQKQPPEFLQNKALLERLFKDCFYSSPGVSAEHAALRDQLELAHWDSGFKPRSQHGNDIINPVELMQWGFHLWRQSGWPGQRGRLRYANILFNCYLLRCVALLLMRLWDAGSLSASERLEQTQALLDQLWKTSSRELPVLVRDVRWLFPVVMSPTTDNLAGYFTVAHNIATTLPTSDRLQIQLGWVQTGGGHLRSQLRHHCVQRGVELDDHALVLLTRVSNTLDIALLMEGMVTLLGAYANAVQLHNQELRLQFAAAIIEGLSPDPELFVNRLDLLGPYSMIDYLFVASDAAGGAGYTPMGERHMQLLQEYKQLLNNMSGALLDDCRLLRPDGVNYSPFGVLYGFSSNLLELMAFKSVQLEAENRFSMEDAFSSGSTEKLNWVSGWRRMPHINEEVSLQFDYPPGFALAVHARVERALARRAGKQAPEKCGRIFLTVDGGESLSTLPAIAPLPVRYLVSSDAALVAAGRVSAKDAAELEACAIEGEYLVSYASAQGKVALSKDLLTEMVGAGIDVKLALPLVAANVLRLMCPALIAEAPAATAL